MIYQDYQGITIWLNQDHLLVVNHPLVGVLFHQERIFLPFDNSQQLVYTC